jgi:thiosulfate reductase cytochrome b subunit
MSEREVMGTAKACAYTIVWLAALIVLLRLIVGALWGSATDIGLIAAVAALAAGVVGLAWLAFFFWRDVNRHFRDPAPRLEHHKGD